MACARLLTDGDGKGDLSARGNVQTNTVSSLHTGKIGVGTGASSVNGGASTIEANLEGGNVEAAGGRDKARSIGTRPAVVGGVFEVDLEPGRGVLAIGGGGDLGADGAGAATLSVGVEGDSLGTRGGEGEGDGLVALPEAVDTTIRSDLVPADAGLVLGNRVGEGGSVVVQGSNALADGHDVAAVVIGSAGVASVGNLFGGSTLLGGAAAAELNVAGAGVIGGGGGSGSSSIDSLGDIGLSGNDEILLVEVSVAAGVSRDAEGGGGDEDGSRELHFDVGFVVVLNRLDC